MLSLALLSFTPAASLDYSACLAHICVGSQLQTSYEMGGGYEKEDWGAAMLVLQELHLLQCFAW